MLMKQKTKVSSNLKLKISIQISKNEINEMLDRR